MKITLVLLAALLANSANAAEIPYRFKILDITVPGQMFPVAGLEDVNRQGQILASAMIDNEFKSILSKGQKHQIIECPDTPNSTSWHEQEGMSLSTGGLIVGYCSGTNSRVSGFVRNAVGMFTFLDVPGALQTMAQGISSDSHYVTGISWEPVGGLKCFLFNRSTKAYTTIEFPNVIPDTHVESNCYAVNNHRMVLGEYWLKDLGNNPLEHGFFIWQNGQFDVPLPLSRDFENGPYIIPYDLNEDQALVGFRNDGTGIKLFYFDDGVTYDIVPPLDWEIYNIGGWNGQGDFVGRVSVKTGIYWECGEPNPELNCGIYEDHGFVAAPRRGALSGLK